MACGDCSNGRGNTTALPTGCKNHGTCGTGGCNKLNVFDWLAGMEPAVGTVPCDWVEVRFKNTRKEFFKNSEGLQLVQGDAIAVEGSPGHDIGIVSLTGELVRVQMKKNGANPSEAGRKIFRKARPNDIERWQAAMDLEKTTMMTARRHAVELNLDMKISDVEYQGDGTKATFYYIADTRVDFRELIKLLARDLRVRIEMRQIGARQEAGRVGGIGACGRELCCASWLKDFRTVTTTAARYQQLSINPQKLAGQCGKLKCCLNYELESYMDALKEFPQPDRMLRTMEGNGVHIKTDIFNGIMYYAYEGNEGRLHKLTTDEVREIMAINKEGKLAEKLSDGTAEQTLRETRKAYTELDFKDAAGEDSLSRFDKSKGNRNKPNRGRGPQDRGNTGQTERPKLQRPAPSEGGEQQSRQSNKPRPNRPGGGERKENRPPNPNRREPKAGGEKSQNPNPPAGNNETPNSGQPRKKIHKKPGGANDSPKTDV
jgi:cell fate regulator YaaT (PSP1 superfamily)